MANQFTASLWGDEAFSAVLSMKSIPEIIKIISQDTSPPLYNLSEHLAFNLFGTSEIVIRGLSFFYYCLACFFVYLIAKHLWNHKTAFLAAMLTFLNPFFFIYAFEGRMYSILSLGVIASMYFFLKRNRFGYIIATTWALYSHHFAFFAVAVQGLWLIVEFLFGQKRKALPMFKAMAVVAILYLPWLPSLYQQITKVTSGFWLATPTPKDLFGLLGKYLGTGINHTLAFPVLVLVLTALCIRNWFKNPRNDLFLLSWFLLPILITYFISQRFQSIFFDRYLSYTIPAAMLLVASERKKFSTTILILIIGFSTIICSFYFSHPTKRAFKEFSAYVKEVIRGDDLLINWNAASHHLWETKYYGLKAPLYVPEGELPFFVGTALMSEEDIIKTLPPKVFRIGVITSGDINDINLPFYTKIKSKSFNDLKFVLYSK